MVEETTAGTSPSVVAEKYRSGFFIWCRPEGRNMAEPEEGLTKALPLLTHSTGQALCLTSQLFQNNTTIQETVAHNVSQW